jgi:tryptophanyl-tRNA synthetase
LESLIKPNLRRDLARNRPFFGRLPRQGVRADLAAKLKNCVARATQSRMIGTVMPRILSGIKPTGNLHLGNYFGMVRPSVEWQDRGQAFYFIADYHAMTTVKDPVKLREYSRCVALDFLACGLDPAKAVLFKQSDVPQVTELTWILSTITPMPMLENSHAYKDHLAKGQVPNHGLFAYPVLMAADILIYDSDIVPVGKDQKQHVEITRDMAVKMNQTYGPILKVPDASIVPSVATIPGLDGQKMSKSYGNTIEIFPEEKALRKKIMAIVTDSTPVEAPKNPENSSIVNLYRLFASTKEVGKMEADFRAGGTGYGEFKKRLFETIWVYFEPMRKRRAELAADPNYIDSVLADGARKANEIAGATMKRVRAAVGLV